VQCVVINALQLPSPQHIYSRLLERMTGRCMGPGKALQLLEEHFTVEAGATISKGKLQRTLLVVDEIDVLITKDQSVGSEPWYGYQGTSQVLRFSSVFPDRVLALSTKPDVS
jgi:Cdc6-like AAA superfamily ATPase